jgi:lambda family phage portal protein
MALHRQQNAFEGATLGFRMEQKGLTFGSADSLAVREIDFLRRRSHHLCRNNDMAITARRKLVTHWIGSGIKVRFNSKVVQTEWDNFIASPSIDGWGNLYNLQSLWASSYFESGEVFTRMVLKDNPNCKVPLLLQTLEAEQLDIVHSQPPFTRTGIEFSPDGKPLTYWFWKDYPGDMLGFQSAQRVPVPAADVLHLFQRDRPGQWRGIPKLSGVLLPLYELDELLDATLVRQKLAQIVAWVVETEGDMPPVLGVTDAEADANEPESEGRSRQIQTILPGGIHYFRNGEKLKFATTEDIGNNFVSFIVTRVRSIASALGITYEQLTGDLSSVNFSSIRAGLIEMRKEAAIIQQQIFINLALEPLVKRFKELGGVYVSGSFVSCKHTFVLPKNEWVDPLKDVQADVEEIRAGLATFEDKLAERGVEDIAAHIALLKKFQELDLTLSTNPAKMKTTEDGQAAGQPAGQPNSKGQPTGQPSKPSKPISSGETK